MIAWYFLIGALALFVTVLLFGFVGCGAYLDAPDISDDYAEAVKSTPGLRGLLAPGGTGHDAGAQQWRRGQGQRQVPEPRRFPRRL